MKADLGVKRTRRTKKKKKKNEKGRKMSMKKLTPVDITAEDQELVKQVTEQVVVKTIPKSRDPKNYPVYSVPVNKKHLIYVPKHIVLDKDGKSTLRMDTPFIHTVHEKNDRFSYYRCISGLASEKLGYDGSCPFCQASDDCWTLANMRIEDACNAKGLSKDDKENEDVKSIRSSMYKQMVVQDASRTFTFPIVLFETVNDDGKTILKDEKGNISYTIMFYSISERMWDQTWAKALDNMEAPDDEDEEVTNPGGYFFTLDYTYSPKKGEPNARDSARSLRVDHKRVKGSAELCAELDKQTEDWTPELASKMVIRNNFYMMSDLEEAAEDVMVSTINLIELYTNKSKGEAESLGAGEEVFNLEKADTSGNEDGAAPVGMDETDEDDLDME